MMMNVECAAFISRYSIFNFRKCVHQLIQVTRHFERSYYSSYSPLTKYDEEVAKGEITDDKYQREVIEKLERVHKEVENYHPKRSNAFSKLFSFRRTTDSPRGIYLYGAVGGGKTMLMDLFFSCCQMTEKRRVHFNEFMIEVHTSIHELKKTMPVIKSGNKAKPFDPIPPVAALISDTTWLLCFDEFQVTDIGDAMILKRLFTALFSNGVVVVATSNRPPDDLYKNGLQRSNFLPFIPILKQHCEVVSLNSGVDYRMRVGTGESSTFFVKTSCEADTEMNNIFKYLSSMENDIVRPRTLSFMGRNVTFKRSCGQVLDSTFSELCDRALGASDYLQLCQVFHTILIRDVPQLSLKLRSQARRFITLIDTLYDNHINVIMSADVPLNQLFLRNQDNDHASKDETRMLMDDLNIKHGEENASSNLFTGDEEIFAFDRTLSRLVEMQSLENNIKKNAKR